MEPFLAYGHALLAMALYAGIGLVLSAMTGIRKSAKGMTPGQQHAPDYADPSYRLDRAYMNTIETLPIFAAITLVAILSGAAPFWINLCASAVLVTRVIYVFAYVRGIGQGYGGLRTILSVLATLLMLAMVALTIPAVF